MGKKESMYVEPPVVIPLPDRAITGKVEGQSGTVYVHVLVDDAGLGRPTEEIQHEPMQQA